MPCVPELGNEKGEEGREQEHGEGGGSVGLNAGEGKAASHALSDPASISPT